MPRGYVLDAELLGLIRREILKSQSSFEPRPKRGRRPRRGRSGPPGETVENALVRLQAQIPAATDNANGRTPGTTDQYVLVKGSGVSGDIENWSLQSIPSGVYLGITKIEGDWVIWPAFC